jgi:hypothetical protein
MPLSYSLLASRPMEKGDREGASCLCSRQPLQLAVRGWEAGKAPSKLPRL